jgi:hypothetical protein
MLSGIKYWTDKMKICLACSHGGHLTEILQLMDAFEGNDVFFITYEGARSRELTNKYTMKNLRMNLFRFCSVFQRYLVFFCMRNPILSFQQVPRLQSLCFILQNCFGKKMFIESLCRVEEPSMTGKIVHPYLGCFLDDLYLINQYSTL